MIMMMVVTLPYRLTSNIGGNMSGNSGVIGGGLILTSDNPALFSGHLWRFVVTKGLL